MSEILPDPGLYDIDESDYHADPAPEPSLSHSVADILLSRCPKAAWWSHPRLNPLFKRKEDQKFDKGHAAHRLLLGKGTEFKIIQAADYRPKPAQIERDTIRSAGFVPILVHQYENALAMTSEARRLLPSLDGGEHAFNHQFGESELCALTKDAAGCWSRALIDFYGHKTPGGVVCWDYKTTEGSANPAMLTPHASRMGWALQAAFQERILVQLTPALAGRISFRFFVQEEHPPYLCSVVSPDGAAMTLAHKMVAASLAIWSKCLKTGVWPGYARVVRPIGAIPSIETAWILREMDDELVQLAANDPFLTNHGCDVLSHQEAPKPATGKGSRGPRGKYKPRQKRSLEAPYAPLEAG